MAKTLKKTIALAAALLSALLLLKPAAVNAQSADYGFNVDAACNALLLVSLDTGEVICEKNADTQVHPASCTKIMTCALAMELCSDLKGTVVTVPEGVWAEFDGLNVSTAGLKVGEELSMYDLVCCMMLQSGNEAASTVRDYYGGQAFIDMMNAKAVELGCTNTHFNNPHGVFVADHYTSARDLALITEWALTVPGFYEISQMSRYDKAATNENDAVTLVTTNLMQDSQSYYYTSYIKGVKTGTTDEAGRCLVSTAQKNGMSFLLVALGGPLESDYRVWEQGGNSAFTDTRLIYDWAFDNLTLADVVDTSKAVSEIPLKYASSRDALLLYPDKDVYAVLNRADVDYEVTYSIELPELIKAPVAALQEIGSAEVLVDGRSVGRVKLVSREEVPLSRFTMTMDIAAEVLSSRPAKIIYVVLLVFLLVYLYYALVVVRRAKKRKKRKKRPGAAASQSKKSGSRR